MKKIVVTIGMCLLAFGLFAQEQINILLGDQQVVAPKFIGEEKAMEEVKQSPICCYLQDYLPFDERINANIQEGTVAIEFTVNKDGTLSNFIVANHVSSELNQSVIDCIKATAGMWKPGETNGQPTAMEKRVYVKFDIPNNPTFEDLVKARYFTAIRKHQKGNNFKNNKLLALNKQHNKSARMYRQSLTQLRIATVYMPNDPSLAFWKARNFEKLGMYKEMNEMLEKRQELLSLQMDEQNLQNHYDLAIVSIK